jgi:hypothetical protein
MTMTCRGCGTENRPGRRFYSECGAPLELACPSCGAANEPGDKFCGACGTALVTTAPEPAPVSERRLVSVLFADLVGFTTLSEHRDPEEVRELLSRYFDRCRTLAHEQRETTNPVLRPLLARAVLERACRWDDPDALSEARAIYEELGATPWLERLDAATTGAPA